MVEGKITEQFMNELFSDNDRRNQPSFVKALDRVATKLRELNQGKGFAKLTQHQVEAAICRNVEDVPKPPKISKPNKMKTNLNPETDKVKKEKWHKKVLYKYTKSFFSSIKFSPQQRAEALADLGKKWEIKDSIEKCLYFS